jgi:peptidoglycan/LPS O-acetylase OafA/YrhL
MFYLFFPVMSRLFGRGKLFVAILLVFVLLGPFARVVFPHGNEVWREYSYLGGMDAIALGCLTALLVSRIHFSRVMLWSLGSIGIALLSLVLCFSNQVERLRLPHSVDRPFLPSERVLSSPWSLKQTGRLRVP